MTKISASAKEIDTKKLQLEAKYLPETKSFLDTIASVSSALFSRNGSVDSQEIAENAKPELVSLLRNIYRDTTSEFESSTRDRLNKPKTVEFDISDEDNQQVDDEVKTESMFFTNNESESQADLISETNAKQIDSSVVYATGVVTERLTRLRRDAVEIQQELDNINFALEQTDETARVLRDKKKDLERQLSSIQSDLNRITSNTNRAIAGELDTKLKELNVARSQTITAQEVGNAESFVRESEARALRNTSATYGGVALANTRKMWNAELDGKTRENHVRADGQVQNLQDPFIVGSSLLMFPRDTSLGAPASEVINCRCVTDYVLE